MECLKCNDGYVHCEECNGSGEDYCGECGNYSDCLECYGSGEFSCMDCLRTGEVQEDEEEELV